MRVVILGGGYAGLALVRALSRGPAAAAVNLTLVDRVAFHTVKTQLHRLAAGSAGPRDVTVPFPHAAYLGFRQGEVRRIEPAGPAVWVGDERLAADVLVVALGSETATFGVPGVEANALTLEGFPEAMRTRAAVAALPQGGRLLIVGGGLTGVELAAEAREVRRDLAVTILEAAASPVPAFPAHIREYVQGTLADAGVEVRCGTGVRAVGPAGVQLANGDELAADAVVWAAGVRPRAVVRDAGFRLGAGQRVVVDGAGQAEGFPGVHVVGDCALLPYPPSAQLAERQATVVAAVLAEMARGGAAVPRPLHLEGVVASLGTREGFSTLFRAELTGGPARQLKTLVEWLYRWHARR